ncbi:hypothetical protein HMPREF9336_04382 [Segniliparus rugosus ATCC BAA-974]|uniref:Uncharacterized protein n=1 Tax=Segniliparus rugosus (strain ATCC BAA-974 / DSM 45345 / CCUG 50838 / CIP 108380 / JCM 13579 / CDC 945) TaxID=679197 RepID=U1N8T0_SEGRC|nr:hypothetical protein HMPREF9336_04382 [Segniliparus rugosus ATCC BAA-974]
MAEAPPDFLEGVRAFQNHDTWQASRTRFLHAWLAGSDNAAVKRHIRDEMGGFGFDVWARAGRVIETAYRAWGSPMERMLRLAEPRPVRHVFNGAAGSEDELLHERFHQEHPWFTYRRLDGKTHFPALELPEQVAGELHGLLAAPEPRPENQMRARTGRC